MNVLKINKISFHYVNYFLESTRKNWQSENKSRVGWMSETLASEAL